MQSTQSSACVLHPGKGSRSHKHHFPTNNELCNKLTPGTISAFPSSFHSETFWLICSRTSCLISPVSPNEQAFQSKSFCGNTGIYEKKFSGITHEIFLKDCWSKTFVSETEVSPENNARNPCCRLLITSIS